MKNKLIYAVGITGLFIAMFTTFVTVVKAESLNFLCLKKINITVTLKNEANITKSKNEISKIPQVKIVKIKYRDEEWSKMVNKMDLPNMENPFKNEFTIKINKKANTSEIINKIKEMNFVENVNYDSDPKCTKK